VVSGAGADCAHSPVVGSGAVDIPHGKRQARITYLTIPACIALALMVGLAVAVAERNIARYVAFVSLRPVDHGPFLAFIAISFINTTLSNLEYNSDRRPTADVKSGPEETPAPSRDRFQWLA
jgi:hypothetical protein